MRYTTAVLIVLVLAPPTRAQYMGCVNLDRVNSRLSGHVVDHTKNHGSDRRIFSTILGMPRDLYIYLPPHYDPRSAYPLVLFFHMASVNEHYFVGSELLSDLDSMIVRGEFPPAIVACPDGIYSGRDLVCDKHSFYINGLGGRFEDHIFQEVLPFLMANYTIRPERGAHCAVGTSAGGYGAMSLSIRHRDFIGASPRWPGRSICGTRTWTATIRSSTPQRIAGRRATTRMSSSPPSIAVSSACARKYITPIFGTGDDAVARIISTNPADLIFSTDLRPGELAIYVHYGCRDEYNFDAQDESFAWLAAQKGVEVTVARDPDEPGPRLLPRQRPLRFLWLGRSLVPPAALPPPVSPAAPAPPGS